MSEKNETLVTPQEEAKDSRLGFLKKISSGVFASLLLPAILKKEELHAAETKEVAISLPEQTEDEDIIVRMMREIQRALAKPVEKRHWAMVIDLRKCVGCRACTVSCIAENKLPPGVVYRPVMEEEIGDYPYVTRTYLPRPCLHCSKPPCTPVCPVRATYKRKDGIVVIDYEKCIGCRYCVTACPYGARSFDFGEFYTDKTPKRESYEEEPAFEYSRKWNRDGKKSPVCNARKCHFCLHRI
ncbi:MAG: 4Fe-4S dicluster domain-containing protein, partial [Actinobacteria bacterium]|nr:4Fe-4S dicluster domain-containing protein [Actinomycetota bacterium]